MFSRKPKNSRGRAPKATRNNADVELLPHLATQPYQRITTIKIPGTTTLVSASAGGAFSTAIALNASEIQNLSRYDFFDEFRLIKAVYELRPVASTTTSGLTIFYIDENDGTAPTISEARTHVGNALSNNGQSQMVSQGARRRLEVQGSGVQIIKWTARDLSDLIFQPIANFATATPAYLKIYTDNGNLGTPAVAAPLFVIRGYFTYQFRGNN
jgi:hypothetical protein